MFEKFNTKRITIDFLFDIIGSFSYALGIYTFAKPANFAPGGIGGLAIIINHFFTKLPIGIMTLVFNIPVILISYHALGKRFLLRSLKTMILSALVLDFVLPNLIGYQYPCTAPGERLLAALFAGMLSGLGLALIYSRGSSAGGTDFIVFSLKKHFPQLSIGNIVMITDGCVIVLGSIVFKEINALLFGVVMTLISTTVMDKLTYGFGSSKMTIIITTKGKEIAEKISCEVERGSTLVNAIGTFTGQPRQMLMCTCNKTEAFEVRRIAYETDNKAMVMMSTVDEAYGYGFKSPDE